MKIITPKFEILKQKPGLQGIYEIIELAGRTCYASTHVIQYQENEECTDSISVTAEKFVKRMIDSGHHAMLEHGTVYLLFSECCYHRPDREFIDKYEKNSYTKVVCMGIDDDLVEETSDKRIYNGDIWGIGVRGNVVYAITTNYRVLVENDWLDDLKYLCEPTEFHEKRATVLFTTDRITGESFLRHRTISEDHPDLEENIMDLDEERNSFARQSTRFCNYSKDKFGNEITITSNSDVSKEEAENVLEQWTYKDQDTDGWSPFYNMCDHIAHFEREEEFEAIDFWLFANLAAEWSYMNLLKKGWKAQQARRVLPFSINSPLVMTAFVSNWEHFLKLRCSFIAETGMPHPDASLLADPLYEKFKELCLIK